MESFPHRSFARSSRLSPSCSEEANIADVSIILSRLTRKDHLRRTSYEAADSSMPGVPSSRACDACRQQKKKCDESNPKCSRCTRLQIPCINNGARRFKFQELKFTPSKPQEHHTGSPAIIVAPHTAYKADGSQPRVTNPKAKRASHNKARNGVQYLQVRPLKQG